MLQNLKLLAFAVATVALGLFTRWADGPPIIAWMLIGLGTLGGLASIVEMVRPGWMAKRASAAEGERVVLIQTALAADASMRKQLAPFREGHSSPDPFWV